MEFRTLKAGEIDCRIAQATEKGVSILLYKDARVDQNILDETVGAMNWQRHHSRENANCTVSIWDQTKGQWIEKEDTGTESNTEAEKGLASDSFKRACFNWGIGRELYTAPFIWVPVPDCTITKNKAGNWASYDRFEVSAIGYDSERNINRLSIRNTKTKKVVFSIGATKECAPEPPAAPAEAAPQEKDPEVEPQNIGKLKIDTTQVAALTAAAKNHGVTIEKINRLYKVSSLADLTQNQFSNINANWENIKKA